MEVQHSPTVWVLPADLSSEQIEAALELIRAYLGTREFSVTHPEPNAWVDLFGDDVFLIINDRTTRRELAPYLVNNHVAHLHLINVSHLS